MDHQNPSMKASKRVQRIRQRLLTVKPALCSERARLATEFYQRSEGMLPALRRAKLLEYILDHMTIVIQDDELIVGNHTETLRGGAIFFPECSADWLENDIDCFESREQDPFLVPEQVRRELMEVIPYWRGKSMSDAIKQVLPEKERLASQCAVSHVTYSDGTGHVLPDYPAVLSKGLNGVLAEIQTAKHQISGKHAGDYQKLLLLDAMEIADTAAIRFARRFAEKALSLAQTASSPRREELLKISDICSRIPGEPCRDLYDAVQAVWFIHLIIQLETNGTGVSIGRLDQYLYPYYQVSLEQDKMAPEEAQELIDSLWLKFEEINKVRNTAIVDIYSGYLTNQAVTIGGVDSRGKDATNPVTYMCLEAQARVHLRSPQLAMRVHSLTPHNLLRKAVEVIKLGGGQPQLIGDEAIISSLIRLGLPLEAARCYGNIGCVEPGVIGSWGIHKGGALNLPKIADLVISNGVDRYSGIQVGPCTGEPTTIQDMESFLKALYQQFEYFVDNATLVSSDIIEYFVCETIPHIFLSTVVPDCISKCQEVNSGGGRYNWTGVNMAGTADLANILAAVRKVVFEDKICTLAELNQALDANFEGFDALRKALQDAPKFGNDDDYVDLLLARVLDVLSAEYGKHETPRGGRYTIGFFPGTMNHHFGKYSGATADGRRSGEPFSDAISPAPGTDTHGPTAVFNSVTKLDLSIAGNGVVLNMKFSPSLFATEEGTQKFIQMNKAYLTSLGGYHVQYNVVSRETLRKAQENPEAYRDLIVRVTGYSAYFTELGRGVQDQIIARTEQGGT
jgi:pyruvate formate-lyase/glycerol dehydratase family glycyl radical enzyme